MANQSKTSIDGREVVYAYKAPHHYAVRVDGAERGEVWRTRDGWWRVTGAPPRPSRMEAVRAAIGLLNWETSHG